MDDSEKRIETEVADVWIDTERIIHIEFKATDQHGIAHAKDIVHAHNELANGESCLVFADIQAVKVGADRAARKYYVSEESARYKTGMAMLVGSPMQRMLGNIFLKLNRPPYPTRLFNQKQAAIQWLKSLEVEA